MASNNYDDDVAELKDTITTMTDRLSGDAKDVSALIFRGDAYFDLGEDEKAKSDFKNALELEPDCASTHYAWARFQMAGGATEEVLKHVQRAIEIDTINPGHRVDKDLDYDDETRAQAQYILADALLESDRQFDALKAIDQAIKLDDKSAQFYLLRGELKRNAGDLGAALEDFNKAVEIDPEDIDVRIERAVALMESDERDKALADIDEAFNVVKDSGGVHPELYATRGDIRAAMGDTLRAREDYRQAIEMDPDNFDAHLGLSELSILSQDYAIAQKHLAEAEKINPDDPILAFQQGVLAKAQGELKTAEGHFDKAIELNEKYAEAYYLRGQVRSDQGNSGGSKEDIEAAEALGFKGAD